MEIVTLYTNKAGHELYQEEIKFCASDEKLFDTDLSFTANKEDIIFLKRDICNECSLYDVISFNSVKWN